MSFSKIAAAAVSVGMIAAVSFCCTTAYAAENERPLSGQSALRKDSLILGANAVMLGKADGGQEPYTYSYSFKMAASEEWTELPADENEAMCHFSPTEAGRYDVRCTVTDANGDTVTDQDRLVIWKDTGNFFFNISPVSDNTIFLGESVELNAAANGGVLPYEYKYFIRSDTESKWKQIRSYNDTANYLYKPEAAGRYTVKMRVRDHTGTYRDKTERLFVVNRTGKTLLNTSTADSPAIGKGETVTMNASAFGGSAPYEYKYYYKRLGGSWIQLKGYSSKRTELKVRLPEEGFFRLRVRKRDFDGNYKDKDFDVTVKKATGAELKNISSVSSTLTVPGNSVTLSGSAEGGTLPYKYRFSLFSEGKWKTLKGYGKTSSYVLSLPTNGCYSMKVDVRDADGRTKTKYLNVDAYSRTASTVIQGSDLMKNSKWACASLCSVPKNAYVNVICHSGRWFRVKYGNKVGWLYNLSLGNYKNYSTINVNTIDAVADDTLFIRGRSMKVLYEYVKNLNYMHMDPMSYEENVAYIMKYHRGACYQRSSLLCYLLNRAGYEAVRVTDGRTRRGPHNWCIVKTSAGYRHIDPTSVLEMGMTYLATDSYMSRNVFWDKSKYPACV